MSESAEKIEEYQGVDHGFSITRFMNAAFTTLILRCESAAKISVFGIPRGPGTSSEFVYRSFLEPIVCISEHILDFFLLLTYNFHKFRKHLRFLDHFVTCGKN